MATQTATTETKRNITYPIVRGIAYSMFAGGLALSVTHIYDLFHSTLGASVVTAAAVPVFVDGLQLIGRLARGHQFAEGTRRIGLWVQMVGAALSLTANVVAGHSAGDKIGGVIFVLGYIFMELFADRMRPASEDAAAIATEQATAAAAKRSATAQKAAATRKANAAAKKSTARTAARKARTETIATPALVAMAEDTRAYV